jgi:hypothetical protein
MHRLPETRKRPCLSPVACLGLEDHFKLGSGRCLCSSLGAVLCRTLAKALVGDVGLSRYGCCVVADDVRGSVVVAPLALCAVQEGERAACYRTAGGVGPPCKGPTLAASNRLACVRANCAVRGINVPEPHTLHQGVLDVLKNPFRVTGAAWCARRLGARSSAAPSERGRVAEDELVAQIGSRGVGFVRGSGRGAGPVEDLAAKAVAKVEGAAIAQRVARA